MMTTELDELTAIVCRVGKIGGIGPDDDFYEAGFSSVNALELLLGLEDTFGVGVPDERFIEARSARALHDLISELRREQAA